MHPATLCQCHPDCRHPAASSSSRPIELSPSHFDATPTVDLNLFYPLNTSFRNSHYSGMAGHGYPSSTHMPSVSDINAHPAQKLSRLRVSPGTISGVPELDYSLSPLDSLSGTDVCNSPVQGTVHVTPDIPLHCPIPVRGNSPQFVQFDCLPDEDEDLSFPPYTRSRRSRKRRRERDGSDGMPSGIVSKKPKIITGPYIDDTWSSDLFSPNQVYVAGLPTDGGIYDRLMGVGLITLPHGESPRAI